MFIIDKRSGAETRYEFKPGRVKLSQQAIIERQYRDLTGEKQSFPFIIEELRNGASVPLRLVLLHCIRALHPTTKLDDVDPEGDEIDVQFHKAELQEMHDAFESAPDFPGKDAALNLIRVQMANAADADPDDPQPGKADGSSSAAPGGESGSTSTSASATEPSPRRGKRTS